MSQLRKYILLLLFSVVAFSQSMLAQRAMQRSGALADSVAISTAMLPADTALVSPADTLANDTTKRTDLEAPVVYQSQDSMVWYKNGNAYLYGSGQVNYQKIELKANEITIDLETSTVYAQGTTDTLGVVTGRPIFADGDTPYESETMSYNFKSRKGFINNVTTQQGEGYMTSNTVKKGANDEFYIRKGRYTTCEDHEHPHFYLSLSTAKMRPNKDVVFGPAQLVVADVPLPLAVPFGFFPFTSDYSSGFIMPSYGDELERGFYLRDGGYYFAFSDYLDLKLTGEIFTKGSWGVGSISNYRKRYKYSGNVNLSYMVTKTGEKNMPDYSSSKNFKIVWSHRQDAKANPNQNFSASVNYATTNYERNNLTSMYNPALNSQSIRTSSVSYSRSFPDQKLNLSSSFNISQNMRDSTLSLTLPSLNISLSRIYPFKKKKAMGEEKWYEKISFTYTGALSNSITAKENEVFQKNLFTDWRNGMKHTIPISATFTAFKYINVTPSFNYTERWYSYKIDRMWDEERMRERQDTTYGFNRVYNYNLAVSANTKLYGFYKPIRAIFGDKVQMIRHVFTPSVSYSLTPDFGDAKYGYYKSYTYTDAQGEVRTVDYSPYAGSLYGVPGKGRSGSINMDVSNNVEMKVKTDRDSTGVRKISIIDELGGSISYNMAAKTKPWSNLSTRIRLKLTKNYTFSLNSVWATYAYEYNDVGRVVVGDRTEWSYGRFGRFQGMSQNFSYTFNNGTLKKWQEKIDKLLNPEEEDAEEGASQQGGSVQSAPNKGERKSSAGSQKGSVELDEDGYMAFKIPWSFSVSYGVSMRENTAAKINEKTMRYPYKLTQNMNFSGNIKISNKWNMNFSSGWDFDDKELTTTTMNISRDLHCFSMSCGIVLKPYTSYNFSIRANSAMLADALKYDQRSSAGGNVDWY
ncbi:MAG: LPS-assembly protein LptD [Bacteroidaceae bacterium]|nr:LPS-assembly protein LptD [Bacteroidaceae bacterium]